MSLLQDVRYATRTLGNSPGFAATAVITIGLGIGACTAIFSCCDALLWKPVPLPNLDRMATVVEGDDGGNWNDMTPADVDDLRHQASTFEAMGHWGFGMANLAGSGAQPERVSQALVSANFFEVVGVQPARG